ncbi:nucleotidyltransferase [Thioclava sp. JM3]|uniref:Y-family DNA polymerase n=1 Tax=Thioclava sp. JM3 TaxID=1973004 RepID=UPI000B54543D|nr:DNA polymerase Y family protein [Thioclava sp. JM3]OWY18112.1 nucleotidyltransferase [Thioclava sp. JM3]
MLDGRTRRILTLWFPRLASDRVLRARPIEGPFALVLREGNTDRLHCLNAAAEGQGLARGMALSEARAFCPTLQTAPADPAREAQFLETLRRWATRYCPWVGLDGEDGLVLDITGSDHLWGGEEPMMAEMIARLERARITARLGLADTRGAAWALAHFAPGRAAPGARLSALGKLPVAALRLPHETVTGLQRLGLREIGDLTRTPRAPLVRRFGAGVMARLDQALGDLPEQVSPVADPPHYGTRLTLPEPIGQQADVMAGIERLLDRLCAKLKENEVGARVLCLTLRRVDQASQEVELRLATPLSDPSRIAALFARGIEDIDAGFGIDQMRLAATQVEALPARQIGTIATERRDRLGDLITRIGLRIGLENVQRYLPADSHIPERSFLIAPAAFTDPEGNWHQPHPRPLRLFPPEPLMSDAPDPPRRFRWRRQSLSAERIEGPERLTPEWWFDDPNWRRGMRDYWRVETGQGLRLWMFHTPQDPGWYVEGVFA